MRNNSLLAELYFGNISIYDCIINYNEYYTKVKKRNIEIYDELEKVLSKEQFQLFIQFVDTSSTMQQLELLEQFKKGFTIASAINSELEKLKIELFNEIDEKINRNS